MHRYIFLALFQLISLSIYSQIEKNIDSLSIQAEITGVYPPDFIPNYKGPSSYFTRIVITNQTDSILTLWAPTCYWETCWVFDSKEFDFNDWGCDGNGFQDIVLKPRESTIFYGIVYSQIHPSQSIAFKIGYIMLNREEWMLYMMGDKNRKREKKELLKAKKVYWSNSVLTKFHNNTFKINN